jgi:hypothetical protein
LGAKILHIGAMNRRKLLESLALGALSAAAVAAGESRAAESAKLDPNDRQAKALGYVENASQVDAKKFPGFVAGSTCDNCLLLQGSAGNSYRPCSLFQGRLVSVGGWCSGWTAEM